MLFRAIGRGVWSFGAGALVLLGSSATSYAQQALPNMDDITCYKPNEFCSSDPNGWAEAQVYSTSRSVCRLKIYAARPGFPEQLHGVCTGWLVDVANRDDLVITSLHCVELGPGAFGGNVARPPRGSSGSCVPSKCEPPPNQPPGVGPQYFVTRVVCEFVLEYGPDCDCENTGGAPCDPLNSCDTPESVTCTTPLVWESTTWADGGDGCDWVLLKLNPNAAGVLPGGFLPELMLGSHQLPKDLVMPQHPEGRCKEIADGIAKGIYDACDFAHDVEAQEGSSGSPLMYLNNGVPEVMGVLHGVIVGGDPPAGIVIGDGVAVDAARVSASIAVAIARVDAPPEEDCIPGGGGGSVPTQGSGGGGTWPGTLPGSPLIAPLNISVPAASTRVVGVKLRGLTHTWIGDVHMVLEEPLGTRHNVVCRPGSNGSNAGFNCDYAGDYVILGGAYTGNCPGRAVASTSPPVSTSSTSARGRTAPPASPTRRSRTSRCPMECGSCVSTTGRAATSER